MARRRKIRRYQVVINNSAKADKWPGLYERHFRKFAFGVICIWILTGVFDFSLMPPSYQGLFITRPYYGLHSWDNANRAWAARSQKSEHRRQDWYFEHCMSLITTLYYEVVNRESSNPVPARRDPATIYASL